MKIQLKFDWRCLPTTVSVAFMNLKSRFWFLERAIGLLNRRDTLLSIIIENPFFTYNWTIWHLSGKWRSAHFSSNHLLDFIVFGIYSIVLLRPKCAHSFVHDKKKRIKRRLLHCSRPNRLMETIERAKLMKQRMNSVRLYFPAISTDTD